MTVTLFPREDFERSSFVVDKSHSIVPTALRTNCVSSSNQLRGGVVKGIIRITLLATALCLAFDLAKGDPEKGEFQLKNGPLIHS